MELYVSTVGNDSWSGKLAEPSQGKTDGPLRTIQKAKEMVRTLKSENGIHGEVTVWVREGIYPITSPIIFGPEDSMDSGDVTYAAYPNEHPVISGGKVIKDWSIEEINGIKVWTRIIPEAATSQWCFRELFVNGERRQRPRLPKQGFYWMEDVPGLDYQAGLFEGSDSFKCMEGDIQNWKSIHEAEIVVLHYWIEERMSITDFNQETRIVKCGRKSIFSLKDDFVARYAKYYVDNVFEALTEPGEWYLDRHSGKLYYIPMPGEEPGNVEVIAPEAVQLVKFVGNPGEQNYVRNIHVKGIELAYTDWYQPVGGGERFNTLGVNYGAVPQGAFNIPGVIFLEGAQKCSIENCTIHHVGWYGIEMSEGCMDNRIVGNEIGDMGAGGIKMTGADTTGTYSRRTGRNEITDNHIHHGGNVFYSGIGILSRHSFGNEISHNHIHDFYYSGISCGWIWGYADNISRDNLICKNHIHDLGKGVLSDMGGIYMLGVQPGTVISGNLIHDVEKSNYGGWGIYTDEGSAHIIIENNICYNTSSQVFNQHYGRENIIRNNIFAFGREGVVSNGRGEYHNQFSFLNNILITDGAPLFVGGYAGKLENHHFKSDLNLLWDISEKELVSGNDGHNVGDEFVLGQTFTMEAWKQMGYDRHSITADPKCKDVKDFDFTLMEDSPAYGLGFKPIDISDVGPRNK